MIDFGVLFVFFSNTSRIKIASVKIDRLFATSSFHHLSLVHDNGSQSMALAAILVKIILRPFGLAVTNILLQCEHSQKMVGW